MANTTFGKPLITGSVLRSDARQRPTAREPSLQPAHGFPIFTSHPVGQRGGPTPTSIPTPPIRCFTARGRRSLARHARTGTAHIPHIRTSGVPSRAEAIAIARARFRTGLTP